MSKNDSFNSVTGKQELVDSTPEDEAVIVQNIANAPLVNAEVARKAGLEAAVSSDATLNDFKAMTNAEFNTWWAANVTTSAQAIAVLKRLARLIIRRVL